MRSTSGFTPRIRPVPPGKTAILSALDVGTSKVVCLIARLDPIENSDVLSGRTHRMRILGIGHQRSRGIKGGTVIDLAEAEKAIRLAVDSAERMAGVQVASALVNISGGRIGSHHFQGRVALNRRNVEEGDITRVIEVASAHAQDGGRSILHALPVGYALDGAMGIQEPKGMVGDALGVDMHIVSCDPLAAHNLMLAVERGHLAVEALVATPYASALSTLCDDEAELGSVVIDIGGGTTSMAVFHQGHLVHADTIAIGGNYITLDIARGLSMRLDDAEKLKNRFASCIETEADSRDILSIRQVGEGDQDLNHSMPLGHLTRIVRPRVEETIEFVRERLDKAGFRIARGQHVLLTGGTAQLGGLTDLTKRIFGTQTRLARPVGVQGLPEAAKSPAFASAVGLLVYPQVAGKEFYDAGRRSALRMTGTGGYFARMGQWLRDSF
ncbi:MAG: cell division protein FtsA [Proteobacteria bacterium]|nr:cell division protein FtsA [Pseudomonadota bacterium]